MKSARRRAREYALQGLYQWLVAGGNARDIIAQLTSDANAEKADAEFLAVLVSGTIEDAASLESVIAPALDRAIAQVSPIERACVMLGAYELKHRVEVPLKVAINEAIELAKAFGGADGHKFVHGVLDRIAPILRPGEARAR